MKERLSMKIEALANSHRFYQQGLITKKEIEAAIEQAIKLVDHNMIKFGERFPGPATKHGEYELMGNIEWTNGFWTGMIWLAYEVTKDEKYRELADKHVESYLDRIEKKIEVNHHDLGFLYIPSCVSAYKLTGNLKAKKAALLAADQLISRYQEKGGFIQAWGELGAEDNYRLIVDCLLNIPLLYWAAEETGQTEYAEMANFHYKATVENAFREDASTFHTYYFDPKTGVPVRGMTRQGYSDGSSWARGQAWSIYGTALQYYVNKDEEIIPDFKAVTNYFLNRLPEDNVPYWDLIFGDGSLQSRDSSSAAIAICGMHEMLKYLPETDSEKQVYQQSMHTMMRSLMTNYTYTDLNHENSLLTHGVYSWHSGKGVDEGNIWGDYFYSEALIRFYKDWELYW
ncbi:glucuronyl hydrolase [Carnobacterium maltaromaticum]|nr:MULTISPECIES: glycoside hydrolase family 88 protein [Lactobacillales]MDT1946625.1 glycoside hydrolase family 88 protein [Carnobacterium maltaromaticum]MDT2001005.1 glycoside hydrolase family 88 protein [Carnobacterium maltaromaticum]TFJ25708.1 glucuronyl hydrolase [Carnobacterium maltaromaticum]TFJ30720.1 glucuronyl hydrolase [Carnobacterium maltaromaticum]TFJ33900.1 glucuronyl hydrolase [Carnobacterium maltaromaticum]